MTVEATKHRCGKCKKLHESVFKTCDPCREMTRKWMREHKDPERKAAYDQERYRSDPQRRIDLNRAWRHSNPDKFLPAHRVRASAYKAAKRGATVEAFTEAELVSFWIDALIDPGACFYCGSEPRDLDHVIPLARNGTHERANLVPACGPCNDSKGAKLLSEWRDGVHQEKASRFMIGRETAVAEPDNRNPTGSVETQSNAVSIEERSELVCQS